MHAAFSEPYPFETKRPLAGTPFSEKISNILPSPKSSTSNNSPFYLKKITLLCRSQNSSTSNSSLDSNISHLQDPNSSSSESDLPILQDSNSYLYPTLCGRKIKYYFYPDSKIPVFLPDEEQFADFSIFVQAIDKIGSRAGLAKVIPPLSWRKELEQKVSATNSPFFSSTCSLPRVGASQSRKSPLSNPTEVLDSPLSASESDPLSLNNVAKFPDFSFPEFRPIVQLFDCRKGVYRQYNVEHRKKQMNLSEFFLYSKQPGHCTPQIGTSTVSSRNKRNNFSSNTISINPDSNLKDDSYFKLHPLISDIKSSYDGIYVDYHKGFIRLIKNPPTTSSQDQKSKKKKINSILKFQSADKSDSQYLYVDNHDLQIYNEIERSYWRNLLIEAPMYGADILGSLFPTVEDFPSWNIRNLKSILNKVKLEISGVTLPYLYVGAWKSTFSWHLEDMDLYSINYVHFGAPKAWFSITDTDCARFERCAQATFAEDYKKCKQFLRHKSFHMSPSFLASQGIKVNRVVQKAGEFIITFPFGYHSGFNHGFNCAESTNFALKKWVEIGRNSEYCKCIPDSVKIDVDKWFSSESSKSINSDILSAPLNITRPLKKTSPAKRSPKKNISSSAKRSKKLLSINSPISDTLEKSNEHLFSEFFYNSKITACCVSPIVQSNSTLSCKTCGIVIHKNALNPVLTNLDDENNTLMDSTDCPSCKINNENVFCVFCGCSGGFLVPVLLKSDSNRRNSKRILEKLNNSLYGHYFCAHYNELATIKFDQNYGSNASLSVNCEYTNHQIIDIEQIDETPSNNNTDTSNKDILPQLAYNNSYITLSKDLKNLKKSENCSLCKKFNHKINSTFTNCSHPGCTSIIHPICAAKEQYCLLDSSLSPSNVLASLASDSKDNLEIFDTCAKKNLFCCDHSTL
ncbi:hypothetical protein BB561_004318 [Smittium simulii]|uniref:[Histone H3]-trimethyl-L-lysine(9) demethylase n=1 Tax=Smittium simulii TaxID=133385 RepID=A0A2T9YGZ6_9FUNG|nr:hypothetical protein BB561_004318 [Smittium simulii]